MTERFKYFIIHDCKFKLEKIDDTLYELVYVLGDEYPEVDCFDSYAEAMAFILSFYEKTEEEYYN